MTITYLKTMFGMCGMHQKDRNAFDPFAYKKACGLYAIATCEHISSSFQQDVNSMKAPWGLGFKLHI